MAGIKRFNNALIYRLNAQLSGWGSTTISGLLAKVAHRAIGKTELRTMGFIPPFGVADEFAEYIGSGAMFLSVGKTERMLPGKVVRRETDDRIAKIEAEQGRKIYRKERNTIKDEVVQDLLPRAFLNHSRIDVLICFPYIFIDTTSGSKADEVLCLLREAVGSLPVLRLETENSVTATMTYWMRDGDTPEPFSLGESFQSRGPSDEASTLSGKGVDLSDDELHAALGTQQIHQLQLIYRDDDIALPFTLTETVGLKGIQWPKEFVDQIDADLGEDDDQITEARATLLLLANTLKPLVTQLLHALGNPDETDSLSDDNEDLV